MLYNTFLMETSGLFEKKFLILREISDAMIITENVTALAYLMLDLAINYTNAEKGSLMLANEFDELYILASRGIDANLARTYRIRIGDGIAGTVARNRRPVLVSDIETDARFKERKRDRYKTRSFISCPVIRRDRLLGVLNINDKKDGTSFTEDEFALLVTIANQAAVVLENTFLMNQLRTKAAELAEINRKLIETDLVKTEFIARVSHDLRTPLNSIKGSIYHLLETGKQGAHEQNEFFEIISNETSTLISTVESLLGFLRAEDEIQLLKKSMIDLADILRDVTDQSIVRTSLAKKQLHLDMDLRKCKSAVFGDRIRVIQLFIYLIEVLSHCLETGDRMKISVIEGDPVRVTISLPRRLPEAAQPFLFRSQAFFLSEYSEEKLKLYLVRKITAVLGWELAAENVNDGFRLSLVIPAGAPSSREAFMTAAMEFFVDFISALMGLEICSLLLSDELSHDLVIRCARGLDDWIIKQTRIRPGESISGWVAREGKPLLVEDIESDPRFRRKNIPQYNTRSLLSLPLMIHDRVIGVLNLNNKKTGEPFTKRDLLIASVVSERFLHLLEKSYSGELREDEYKQLLASFENLLNAEKKYHKKDAFCTDLMVKIMEALGRGEEEHRLAIYASMLYDLGLVLISEATLGKKKLLSSEIRSIKGHPVTGVSLLDHFEFSEDIKKAILHHHERYDGTGYPDGLRGEAIPFISRVLSVVDSYCSLIRDVPYRKAFTKEAAIKQIKKGSGSLYDPAVVDALETVLREVI